MNDSRRPQRREWLKLSDEFESAIGRMIVTFAHLEGNLRSVISALVGGDRGKVLPVLSSLDFRKLVGMLPVQLELVTKTHSDIEQSQAWVKKAEKVANRRNRFVHDQLVFLHRKGAVSAARFRHATRQGAIHVFNATDLNEVRQLSQQVGDLSNELIALHDSWVKTGTIPRTTFDGLMRSEA